MTLLQKIHDLKEKLRIKHHLLGAKWQYDQNTTSKTYNGEEIEIRQATSQNLSSYIKEGSFPKNTELDHYAPAIRDKYGTLCAMAYLIDETEDHELVDDLDEEGRYKYIEEFQAEQLPLWLEENHMQAEEAARIQPTYGPIVESSYFSLNPIILMVLAAQIVIFSSGIALYWLKFRSKDLQLYVKAASPSSFTVFLHIIAIILLVLSYIFPIYTISYNAGGGFYAGENAALWLLSPTFSSVFFPILLLVATLVFHHQGTKDRYVHPVLALLLVVSTGIYLFSMIYYYNSGSFVLMAGDVLLTPDFSLAPGYYMYWIHSVLLVILAMVSYFGYRENSE